MKKYRVLKAWNDVEVGQVLEEDKSGDLFYGTTYGRYIRPHEIALLLNAGIIEEVGGRWKPEEGEHYFWPASDSVYKEKWEDNIFDKVRFNAFGVYKTEAEAEAMRQKFIKLAQENV